MLARQQMRQTGVIFTDYVNGTIEVAVTKATQQWEGSTMTPTDTIDAYTRVTNRILADLEKGVRLWMKAWSGEKVATSIIGPLRHNGLPYRINILALWGGACDRC
jgi:antirestriction protein ArdC